MSKKDFSVLTVQFSNDISNAIKKWVAKNISMKDIDPISKNRLPSHITVKYGIHTDNPVLTNIVAQKFGKSDIDIELGKVSVFKNRDNDVLKIDIKSKDLTDLNKMISSSLKVTDTHPYSPHLTLAYLKPGTGDKYSGADVFDGVKVKFDRLEFTNKLKHKYKFRLMPGKVIKTAMKRLDRSLMNRLNAEYTIPKPTTFKASKKKLSGKSIGVDLVSDTLSDTIDKEHKLSKVGFVMGFKKRSQIISQSENAYNYIIKSAQLNKTATGFWTDLKQMFKNNWKPLAAVAAGITVPAVGKYFLDKSVEELMKDPGFRVDDTEKIIRRAKSKSGLSDVPHRSFSVLNNAMYVPPGAISENRVGVLRSAANKKMLSKNKLQKETGKMFNTMIEYSTNPKGGIIIGKKFDNPYVIAHELGHAKLNQEGGIYGFMQKYGPLAQTLGIATTIGSLVPRFLDYKDVSSKMFWSGLGISGLGLGSELLYEHKASDLAKEMLKNERIADSSSELGKKMLDKSLKSYMYKSLGRALPVGGALATGGFSI